MRAEAARDPNAVSRFLREARAATALSSEHVAGVLDVATVDRDSVRDAGNNRTPAASVPPTGKPMRAGARGFDRSSVAGSLHRCIPAFRHGAATPATFRHGATSVALGRGTAAIARVEASADLVLSPGIGHGVDGTLPPGTAFVAPARLAALAAVLSVRLRVDARARAIERLCRHARPFADDALRLRRLTAPRGAVGVHAPDAVVLARRIADLIRVRTREPVRRFIAGIRSDGDADVVRAGQTCVAGAVRVTRATFGALVPAVRLHRRVAGVAAASGPGQHRQANPTCTKF